MEKSYRIKANVGKDQFLNVNLKRDVDTYEVLSLKLSQENIYKLHSSNYGVIVGRVLANDAFGVPNAKVSVFIPIKPEDELRSDIKGLYPYHFVTSYDSKQIRFNTLPDYSVELCHKPVGSFPSKRKVLDEDVAIEVYDKYYKYTTVTNNSGDYMIFGVPVGEQIVHVDLDLSDIGVLSQRPTDFIYKGYSIDLFESPSEFKQSTNLSELPQIISEDTTVNVYPLWGDKDENEIAITRKDVRIQYKFEPTCVFIGSVVTDSSVNSISQNCVPNDKLGEAGQLTAAEGTIEMIRKTIFDTVEEVNIKGNQLIDSNGVWCYQIPMNLDFVCTDEYGNIVPTDNPTRGIPTRARVRFRITLNESDNESISSHKARYLIPNNPDLLGSSVMPMVKDECLGGNTTNGYYEFGTLTSDECFRDLLWNKVYSVKSYIPRVQKENSPDGEKVTEFIGIKGVNKKSASGINPLPFNKLNLNFSIPAFALMSHMWKLDDDGNGFYNVRKYWNYLNGNQIPFNIDAVRERVIEDMDAVGLDFYNDWLNGCLYFPNWYWYLRTTNDEHSRQKYDSDFCSCDKDDNEGSKLCVFNNCSFIYSNNELQIDEHYSNGELCDNMFTRLVYGSSYFDGGVIKKVINKDGLALYYYSFGQKRDGVDKKEGYTPFVRLFSTDIILLGSLNDCDIHGIPKVSSNLPSTTSDIPPIGRLKAQVNDAGAGVISDEYYNRNRSTINGMSWGEYWYRDGQLQEPIRDRYHGVYSSKLSSGLFFGVSIAEHKEEKSFLEKALDVIGTFLAPPGTITNIRSIISLFSSGESYHFLLPFTNVKSCVNAERICELGVVNDSDADVKNDVYENEASKSLISKMDGLITRREILDTDTRALFATLNSVKPICEIETDATGYKTYNLDYIYPTNFDGRLEELAPDYTQNETHDVRSKDYLDFRFGSISNNISYITEQSYGGYGRKPRMGGTRSGGSDRYSQRVVVANVGENMRHFYGEPGLSDNAFPVYDNSFYFYFGINAAHNAISEFYKNFLSTCEIVGKDPFSLKLSLNPADFCNGTNGSITCGILGAAFPVALYLFDSNNEDVLGDKHKEDYFSGIIIPALNNGRYTLEVVDANGRTVSEEILLAKEPISLDFSVTSNIQAQYIESEGYDAKAKICENKQYGIIVLKSYDYDNKGGSITELPTPTIDGNKIIFTNGDKYKITITLDSDETDINKYYCGFDKNEVYFGKPGSFLMRIEEPDCPQNYTDYNFTISDNDGMDLYINTMPLKFFVGLRENDLSTYAAHFYTDAAYGHATDINRTKGWFGVHDPKVYDSSFYGDATEGVNKELWRIEKDKYISASDILTAKFKKLFNVASNAYITNGTENKYDVRASGGNTLLRAAYPRYENASDKGGEGSFNSYVTCNTGLTKNCPENLANIVAGNYKFTDDKGIPSFTEDEVNGFNFNPKYNLSSVGAGNYFAAFSNNANYAGCRKKPNAKKPISIPYGADDLSSYNLCPDSSVDSLYGGVYSKPPYFRTEFIDRRLDYDLIYVTPCKTTDRNANDNVWANGRLSGLTYNGIEMAYKDTYVISSDGSGTEYKYNRDKSSLELNTDGKAKKKRLYTSNFNYGGHTGLDLRELYYSKNRKSISSASLPDYIKIHDHSTDTMLDGNEFDNFGLSEDRNTVLGYPTKRLLDIYNIPYGSGVYTWDGQSCLYDASFTKYDSISTKGASAISNSCDFNNSLEVTKNELIYKIKDAAGHVFCVSKYNNTSKINAPDINGLAPKLMGVGLIEDDAAHTKIKKFKETTTGKTILELFNDSSNIAPITPASENLEINKTISGDSVKFIGIGMYHLFRNGSFDNLLKRVRVFNFSNYYNVGDITFKPSAAGSNWITPQPVKGDEEKTIEVFNFLMSTNAFTVSEISSFKAKIELGGKEITYDILSLSEGSNPIPISIELSSHDVKLKECEGCKANIEINISLENKIKYILPFKIDANGNIS